MSHIQISIGKKQLNVVIESIQMRYEMDHDMVMDDLWVSNDTRLVNKDELAEMRTKVDKRINELLELQALKIQLESLVG